MEFPPANPRRTSGDGSPLGQLGHGNGTGRNRTGGEQWDGDLGLYYNRARYYAPELGRFWSMDSYEGCQGDPLSLHKYLYCHADPVNRIDPSGNFDLISTMGTWGNNQWNRTKEVWVLHPIRSRVLVTLSVLGLAYAPYEFFLAPGVAGFKTTGGQQRSISYFAPSSELTELLKKQPDGSLQSIAMTGHADAGSFKIGKDTLVATGADGHYSMNDDKGNDIVAELKRTLSPNAKVYLNGCHSAELAQKLSTVLRGASVFGYKTYILGGNAAGVNAPVCGFGSRANYVNGEEQDEP